MEKIIAAIVLIAESLRRIADSLEAKQSLVTGGDAVEVEPEAPKSRRSRKEEPATEEEPPAEDVPADEPAAEEDVTAETDPEEPGITAEELQALAQKAVKKGRTAEIKVWLSKRKAPSVGTMDPKHYVDAKAFLTKLAS
jgi:hypothetical protein